MNIRIIFSVYVWTTTFRFMVLGLWNCSILMMQYLMLYILKKTCQHPLQLLSIIVSNLIKWILFINQQIRQERKPKKGQQSYCNLCFTTNSGFLAVYLDVKAYFYGIRNCKCLLNAKLKQHRKLVFNQFKTLRSPGNKDSPIKICVVPCPKINSYWQSGSKKCLFLNQLKGKLNKK